MSLRILRHSGIAAIVALALLIGTPSASSAAGQMDEARHVTGLEVLRSQRTVPPLPEKLARALHLAWELAESNPKDLGYPWVDRAGGRLVLDAVGSAGKTLAADFRRSRPAMRVRDVTRSFADLEKVKDEVIELTSAQIPEGDAIWETVPDGEHNRIIVTVERMSDALLSGLAARYGTEAIAIRFDPSRPKTAPQADRNYDGSPFWGGTRIHVPEGTCTSGFPWISGSTQMMVTAGHCAPSGGWVSTSADGMGSVASGSRESWTNGTGTVYMTGQSTYRGDIALIQMTSGRYAGCCIYRGPAGASSNYGATVKEMWQRRAAEGDRFCIGGHVTGEMCGWEVSAVRMNHEYDTGEIARNVNRGFKQGQCTIGGDSGAPVYTVRSDGGIAAKGIHSGGGGGGSDNWGGAWDPCHAIFTDIWDVYYAFPGTLKTG